MYYRRYRYFFKFGCNKVHLGSCRHKTKHLYNLQNRNLKASTFWGYRSRSNRRLRQNMLSVISGAIPSHTPFPQRMYWSGRIQFIEEAGGTSNVPRSGTRRDLERPLSSATYRPVLSYFPLYQGNKQSIFLVAGFCRCDKG